MAQVRHDVAHDVERNHSVKSIMNAVIENEEYTKWDVVKVFLWCMWYTIKPKMKNTWCGIKISSAVLAALVFYAVFFVVLGALTIVSPLWYPFMMWFYPQRAANLISEERDFKGSKSEWKDIFRFPCFVMEAIFFYYCLRFFWGWTWRFMPMEKRQYFVRYRILHELPIKDQLEFYRLQKDKIAVINRMNNPAINELWKKGTIKDKANILETKYLDNESGQELFNGSDEMFSLLKKSCAEDNDVEQKLLWFFADQMVNGEENARKRAYEVMQICCQSCTFENAFAKMLAAFQGREDKVGEQMEELLKIYFGRHSFTDSVVNQIAMFATERVEDVCRERNFKLLCQIVRRDGLSEEAAETFFERCSDEQKEIMSNILKIKADCDIVKNHYNGNGNREKWQQYCKLNDTISDEAQVQMDEWQYDIFHKSKHQLSESVCHELLVKGISKDNVSYLKKVLMEKGINNIPEKTMTLIKLVSWKRDVIFSLMEAELEP